MLRKNSQKERGGGQRMKRKWIWIAFAAVIILIGAWVTTNKFHPEYAYMPPKEKVMNTYMTINGYDHWGEFISSENAQ
jgi:hypothetical protein